MYIYAAALSALSHIVQVDMPVFFYIDPEFVNDPQTFKVSRSVIKARVHSINRLIS